MRNPWGILLTWKNILGNVWHAAFGNRMRQLVSLVMLSILGLVIYSLQGKSADQVDLSQLDTAIGISRFFEHENRKITEELDDERRRRRLAEQTISALADNIKEQDQIILDQSQQISFYRQLLEERSSGTIDTVFRSFDIVPDYREWYHQLSAVLVRSGSSDKPFVGRLELALSLVDSNGRTFDHRPPFTPGTLDLSFRYYHEAQAVFSVPPGTEILNAQVVLLDESDEVVVSRTLHEQGE